MNGDVFFIIYILIMNSCAASIYANIVACMNCLFETISMRTGPLNDVEYMPVNNAVWVAHSMER